MCAETWLKDNENNIIKLQTRAHCSDIKQISKRAANAHN